MKPPEGASGLVREKGRSMVPVFGMQRVSLLSAYLPPSPPPPINPPAARVAAARGGVSER